MSCSGSTTALKKQLKTVEHHGVFFDLRSTSVSPSIRYYTTNYHLQQVKLFEKIERKHLELHRLNVIFIKNQVFTAADLTSVFQIDRNKLPVLNCSQLNDSLYSEGFISGMPESSPTVLHPPSTFTFPKIKLCPGFLPTPYLSTAPALSPHLSTLSHSRNVRDSHIPSSTGCCGIAQNSPTPSSENSTPSMALRSFAYGSSSSSCFTVTAKLGSGMLQSAEEKRKLLYWERGNSFTGYHGPTGLLSCYPRSLCPPTHAVATHNLSSTFHSCSWGSALPCREVVFPIPRSSRWFSTPLSPSTTLTMGRFSQPCSSLLVFLCFSAVPAAHIEFKQQSLCQCEKSWNQITES